MGDLVERHHRGERPHERIPWQYLTPILVAIVTSFGAYHASRTEGGADVATVRRQLSDRIDSLVARADTAHAAMARLILHDRALDRRLRFHPVKSESLYYGPPEPPHEAGPVRRMVRSFFHFVTGGLV